jgi:Na+-translocating ferredoxin:NAD+ oxidoreductase RnfG subunit
MRTCAIILVCCLVLAGVSPAGTPSVHDRAVASMKAMFGDSAVVARVLVELTRTEADSVARVCQSRWGRDTVVVYTASSGGRTSGYGFLDDVKGKLQFITMLTGLLPDGSVNDVDILVYRESYGGEVSNDSFRRQFRGLTPASDIRPGATIRNISGATISARAVTLGVRRVVATFPMVKERIPR